ncbi:hypothetical protein D3C84_973150 [compost metagenome]
MVVRAHVNVIDVTENPAAGTHRDTRQKLPFGNRRMLELQVGGRIFDENLAAEPRLRLVYVSANDVERLFRQRQR